jgi:hypothetical protein
MDRVVWDEEGQCYLCLGKTLGIRISRKDGGSSYLSNDQFCALRLCLAFNAYPQYGDLYEVVVKDVPTSCKMLIESGSIGNSVVVVTPIELQNSLFIPARNFNLH